MLFHSEPPGGRAVHPEVRALGITSFLILCASPATADDPPAQLDRIRARLASKVPVEVAWGLADAVEARLPISGDALRGVLSRWANDSSWAGCALRAAAIDAAILLDVDLESSVWRPLASGLGTPRLLLLVSRDPENQRDLLYPLLTERHEDYAWTAACNLLLPLRDQVLTAHLLGRLQLRARIRVRDPGPEDGLIGLGGGAGAAFGGVGCGRIPRPPIDDWPPRYGWELVAEPYPGARLVAKGRTSIYADRRKYETGGFFCSAMPCQWSRDYDASQYLADLLGWELDTLRSSLSDYRTVEFTGLDAWTKAVEGAKQDLSCEWMRLLVSCVFDGLLGSEDAGTLPPRFVLDVRDERKVHEPPLPGASRR